MDRLIKAARMTRREQEVVALIDEGKSNKEIATGLNITILAVKSSVHNILEKPTLNTRLRMPATRCDVVPQSHIPIEPPKAASGISSFRTTPQFNRSSD